MSDEQTRRPTAFILDGDEARSVDLKQRRKITASKIEMAVEGEPQGQMPVQVLRNNKPRRLPLTSLLISALLGLLLMWVGLSVVQLVEGLFVESAVLGWVGLATAILAAGAATGIIVREIWGLWRLKTIAHIQDQALRIKAVDDDAAAATTVAAELGALYRNRPELALNLSRYDAHHNDIMSGSDRLSLFDRLVIEPLDAEAHRVIARRARRVTLLTTVTPIASLDVLLVASQNLAMLRELAALYGGRPSTLSTLKLARLVVGHLAVTGGLALSDTLLQHVVGKGLLGRLSARFGEGAINGIMTSRIGLAARDVCRPLPQDLARREGLPSLLKELVSLKSPRSKDLV